MICCVNLILFHRNNIGVSFSYQEKQELVLHPGCHTFLITKSCCSILNPRHWEKQRYVLSVHSYLCLV